MNVRHALIAGVVVAVFGGLGGAACGGQLNAAGAGGSVTSDGGATDALDACASPCGLSGSEAGAPDSAVLDGAAGPGMRPPIYGMPVAPSDLPAPDAGAYPPVDGGSSIGDIDAAVGSVDGGGAGDNDGSTGCAYASASFSADIIPIFRETGCALSSVCHGQMGNSGEENLYLGMNSGGGGSADISAVYSGLVGVASEEDPSMNLVTPGDPSSSYLWHKVVGDQNSNAAVASGCAKATTMCSDCNVMTPCGTFMPYYGEMLSGIAPDDLCTLQNWISEGAPNN